MPFYEETVVNDVCLAFTRWNGWGPPTSEYAILEFCQAKSSSEEETEKFTEILRAWMDGDYQFKTPLWVKDEY